MLLNFSSIVIKMRQQEDKTNGISLIISAIAAIGGFLFGFDTGVISGTLIFLQDAKGWALTDSQLGGVTTAVLVGSSSWLFNKR